MINWAPVNQNMPLHTKKKYRRAHETNTCMGHMG